MKLVEQSLVSYGFKKYIILNPVKRLFNFKNRGNMSSRLYTNSEPFASEFMKNLKEMFTEMYW